jgi:hypothetical protein
VIKHKKVKDLLSKVLVTMQALTIASICGLGWLLSHSKVNMVQVSTNTVNARRMAVTAYIPTGNMVATMRRERPGLDAAVSPDRIDLLGKRVYIKCSDKSLGVRDIVDITDGSISNTIDLMVPDKKLAKEFGMCKDCEVMVLP